MLVEHSAAVHTPGPEFFDGEPAQGMGVRPPCRILIVDDDILVRKRLSILLNPSDYQVEEAATGTEALSVLVATPCHIVLTDWLMPDMDGLELCRQLRLQNHTQAVYVLMLTVRDTELDMTAGLAAGADDYVVKGTPLDEIVARIEIGRRITRQDQLRECQSG